MLDRMSLSKYCLLSTKLVKSGCDDENLKNATSVGDVLTGEKVDLGKLITDYLNDEDNALVSCDCLAEIEIHVRVIEKIETRFEFKAGQKDESPFEQAQSKNLYLDKIKAAQTPHELNEAMEWVKASFATYTAKYTTATCDDIDLACACYNVAILEFEKRKNNWDSNMERLITINDTYYQPSHEANP